MSLVGQTEKNSVRAYVFRFALKLGNRSAHSGSLKGARGGSRALGDGVAPHRAHLVSSPFRLMIDQAIGHVPPRREGAINFS